MRLTRSLTLVLAGSLVVGVAVAQGEPAASAGANARPDQQYQVARQFRQQMAQASEQLRTALEQARASRDVVKVLCLDDKLNQVDIAARSADGRVATLGQAVQQNDAAKARHDFAVLEVLNERVQALVAESSQCVGEEVGFIGEAKMAVTVDPEIPEPDVDRLGSDEIIGVALDSPVLSSPVL
jgi:hypothetical protein